MVFHGVVYKLGFVVIFRGFRLRENRLDFSGINNTLKTNHNHLTLR